MSAVANETNEDDPDPTLVPSKFGGEAGGEAGGVMQELDRSGAFVVQEISSRLISGSEEVRALDRSGEAVALEIWPTSASIAEVYSVGVDGHLTTPTALTVRGRLPERFRLAKTWFRLPRDCFELPRVTGLVSPWES